MDARVGYAHIIPSNPLATPQAPAVDAANLVKKPPGEVVRYDREFLLRFSQVCARDALCASRMRCGASDCESHEP